MCGHGGLEAAVEDLVVAGAQDLEPRRDLFDLDHWIASVVMSAPAKLHDLLKVAASSVAERHP
jgi:hypothetical protein